jgi:hypothetical protein
MKRINIKIVDESQVIQAQSACLSEEEAIKEAARKNRIVAYC